MWIVSSFIVMQFGVELGIEAAMGAFIWHHIMFRALGRIKTLMNTWVALPLAMGEGLVALPTPNPFVTLQENLVQWGV